MNIAKRILWISMFLIIVLSCQLVLGALTDGLFAFYPFNNNTNDVIGTYNLANAGVDLVAGEVNMSVLFNSGTDKLSNVSASYPFNASVSNMSICLWINSSSTADYQRVIVFGDAGSTSDRYGLQFRSDPDNGLKGWRSALGGTEGIINLTITHGTNVWHHACTVFSSNGTFTYHNGVFVATNTNNALRSPAFGWLYIGLDGTEPFGGMLDEIGIWNRSLSEAEMSLLYSDGLAGVSYPFILDNTPVIAINSPPNNTYTNIANNTFILNTTATKFVGTVNTTQNVYYSNGTLFQSISNLTDNVTNIFKNLSTGVYYFNASATNTTNTTYTDTRIITVYQTIPYSTAFTLPNCSSRYTYGGNESINVSWNNSVNTTYYELYFFNALSIGSLKYNGTSNTTVYGVNNLTSGNYLLNITSCSADRCNSAYSNCSINVCVNNYVVNQAGCVQGLKLVTYTDSSACNNRYSIPADNGTYTDCVSTQLIQRVITDDQIVLLVLAFLIIISIVCGIFVHEAFFGMTALMFAFGLSIFLYYHYNSILVIASGMMIIIFGVMWAVIGRHRR